MELAEEDLPWSGLSSRVESADFGTALHSQSMFARFGPSRD
jgi:hypothetical protein